MKKILLLMGMCVLFLGGTALGQTLTAGDIAIIGVGVDDEEVLLVALADIPSGESVFITDDEWATTVFNSGEGFLEWVTPAITAGDVFTFTTSGVTGVTGSDQGTVTSRAGSFALGNSGDGVYIYQTSTNVYNTGTYTILGFAGEDSGDAGTLTGTGLTEGEDAVFFAGDNGIYNGVRTGEDAAGFLGLIYDSAEWATSGTSQTLDETSFTISSGAVATKLVITAVNSSTSPSLGVSFDVNVELQDASNSTTTASQDTSVTLSLASGTGALGGTLTGTVSSGQSSVTFSGITYDTEESGVSITATNTGGSLTAGTSSTFSVLAAADQLVLVSVPTSGFTNAALSSFTVEARRSGDSSVDLNYTSSITVSKASGTGTIGGTLSQAASSGVSTFGDITFDATGDFTIEATDGSLTSSASSTITITTVNSSPGIGDLFISEYSDASGSGNFIYEFLEIYNSSNEAVDVNGYTVRQQNSTASFTFSSSTVIPPSGFLVIGRNADESAFETFWSTTLSDDVTYVNAGNSFGSLNGGEDYLIEDGSGVNVDPATDNEYTAQTVSSSGRVYRIDFSGNLASDFNTGSSSDGNPGILDFEATVSGNAGWRLLSVPKESAILTDISDDTAVQGITGGDNTSEASNVKTYDSDAAFEDPTNVTTAWGDGLGIALYFYNNTDAGSSTLPITLDATGTEPSSDVAVTLNPAASGYTLVGNPFASNFSADATNLTASGAAIQNTISFWNDGTGSYSAQDRTTPYIIAPWQGFWVQLDGTGGATTLTFDTDGKSTTAATGTFFSKEVANRGDIAFTLSSETTYDEAIRMSFRDNATLGYDLDDAGKLVPLIAQYATMAFNSNNLLKSVESLPWDLEEAVTISMEAQLVGVSGSFTLDWSGMESIPSDWALTFHDYETETNVDMRTASEYTFEGVSSTSEKVNPLSMLTGPAAIVQKSKSDGSRFGITVTPTTAVSNELEEVAERFALDQNYPNPFNPSTTINYSVENTGQVSLSVYNVMGQKVAELVNGTKAAGSYNVSWNASGAASGMYYYRLEAGGQVLTRKMTLIK